MVDGINNIFKTGQKIELKDRGAKGSGITFELKSVFEELSKQGIIKDKDGKGLTKQDALNLYNTLNKIHQDTNRASNYTTMQVGQSFDYSAEELKAMAEAAGYEIVAQGEEGAPANPDALDPSKDEPAGLPTETSISDEPLDKPQGNQRAQTEAMIDKLGGKIIERSVNGQKQDIAVVEIDGQTVRREINEDGTLGDNLAATKTFGKNEYISGDFPPETKVLEREVNGKKQQIGIYEDENGNKMRRLVEQDPNTGEYRLGDNLVAISTAGKNKYITQTEMDNRMRQALGLADNEAIPEDIKGEFVSIGGEPTLVFKQDGKVMDNAQLKEYVRGLQEQRVEKFDSQIAQFGAAEINDSEKLASAQFDVINNKYGDKQGNVNSDEYFNYEMSSMDKDALAQEGVTEDILREVSNFNFNVIDENGDGEITKDELKTYYDNANKNGDNIITADEITQYGSESMLNRMQPNIEKVVADGYEVQDFEGSPVFVKDGKTYWMNMDGTLGDLIEGITTQPEQSIDTTPGVESVQPSQTTVPEQTTINGEDTAPKAEYSFDNDRLYQKMESALNELEAKISQYEDANNGKSALFMNGDGFFDYRRDKFMYDSLKRDFDSYTKIMTNWQDGTIVPEHTKIRTINGHTILNVNYTNVETITLKNGERAYKTDQGTFYPFRDGTPGEEKVPEELLP